MRNAGRRRTNLVADEETGEKVWILTKIHPDRKFDLCMAAILSEPFPLPPEMTRRAVWGREYLAGVVSEVAMVRFGGCVLHWRQ